MDLSTFPNVKLAGWTTELTECLKGMSFQLEFCHVMVLMRMRATYVVQLLVSTCEKHATAFQTLFKRLREPETLKSLTELDACIISGAEAFCEAWTSALVALNNNQALDKNAILKSHGIKILDGSSSESPGAKDESSDDGTTRASDTLFGVNDLIQFTTCSHVLPADANMALMQLMQLSLFERARRLVENG